MRHRLSEDTEYACDEQAWSNRQEAGFFDDDNYQLAVDGFYHSIPLADQSASDEQIERAEAEAA